jgi:RND family efflux transporter MFP subunit
MESWSGWDLPVAINLKRMFDRKAMKNGIFITALCAALVVSLTPCFLGAQPPKNGGGAPAAFVEVERVLEQEVLTRITLVGNADPWLETIIASEEAGLVSRVFVDEGDEVSKGKPLCKQNDSQIKLTIETAKAALAEAKVVQVKTQREWDRQKRLYNIKSVSEKAYDDARFDAEAAQKGVLRLAADVRLQQDRLRKMTIKAPVSGFVVKRHALVGQWLDRGDPVVTLAVLDPIRFMVPVPERYISFVQAGDMAQVTFDALPNQLFEGEIEAIIPLADEAARTFPVRVRIENPTGKIKAGKLGRVTLPVGNPHKALLVPKDALVLSASNISVFVVNDSRAHIVRVEMGPAHGALVEVRGDLKAGAKVVVRGNERLRPGQPVRIIPRGDRTEVSTNTN